MLFCWLHIQVRFTRSRPVMNVSIFLFTELSFKIIQTYLPNVTIICISSTLVNIFLQFYITFSSQDRYGTVYKSYELWNMIFAKEPLYTSIQGRGLKRLPSGLSSFHNQNRSMLLSLIFSNIKEGYKMKSEEIKKTKKTHRHRPKVLHVLYETPAVYENTTIETLQEFKRFARIYYLQFLIPLPAKCLSIFLIIRIK